MPFRNFRKISIVHAQIRVSNTWEINMVALPIDSYVKRNCEVLGICDIMKEDEINKMNLYYGEKNPYL